MTLPAPQPADEEEAAWLYDQFAIQLHKFPHTNFEYLNLQQQLGEKK